MTPANGIPGFHHGALFIDPLRRLWRNDGDCVSCRWVLIISVNQDLQRLS